MEGTGPLSFPPSLSFPVHPSLYSLSPVSRLSSPLYPFSSPTPSLPCLSLSISLPISFFPFSLPHFCLALTPSLPLHSLALVRLPNSQYPTRCGRTNRPPEAIGLVDLNRMHGSFHTTRPLTCNNLYTGLHSVCIGNKF